MSEDYIDKMDASNLHTFPTALWFVKSKNLPHVDRDYAQNTKISRFVLHFID